ncbi:DUF4329 domain-containing protein [Pelomonas sp. CA6]|uniref:DUF4329 domain-containing protein n=1 Tax=Pelomonas sp. CA6 TaxID=2907999 RepID=UPI0035A9801F
MDGGVLWLGLPRGVTACTKGLKERWFFSWDCTAGCRVSVTRASDYYDAGYLDGTYTYSAPVTGTSSSIPGFPSAPSNVAGWYHTHGAYSSAHNNEVFSGSDKSILNRSGIPGHLGTPSGAVKKYSPTTGDTSSMGGCP